MTRNLMLLVIALTMCLGLPVAAHADLILPDTVTLVQSSQFFSAQNLNKTTNMGLGADGLTSDDIFTANSSASNCWVTNASGIDYFTGTVGPTPILTFTFDTAVDIDQLVIWNYNNAGGPGNGAKNGTVEFSINGGANWSTPDAFVLAVGYSGGAYQPGTVIDSFGTVTDVNAMRLTLTDNYANLAGGDRVGLGTVAVNEVPEPATMSLLVLGGVAMLKRRKR